VDLRIYRRVSAASPGTSQAPDESSLFVVFFFCLPGEARYRRGRLCTWALSSGLCCKLPWIEVLGVTAYKWGWILFFLELACIGPLVILLAFLVYTGNFDRSSLPREIGKDGALDPLVYCRTYCRPGDHGRHHCRCSFPDWHPCWGSVFSGISSIWCSKPGIDRTFLDLNRG